MIDLRYCERISLDRNFLKNPDGSVRKEERYWDAIIYMFIERNCLLRRTKPDGVYSRSG